MRKAHLAVVQHDDAALAECYSGPPGYERMLSAAGEYVRTVHRFHRALVEVFGADAVGALDRVHTQPSFVPTAPPPSCDWIDQLSISENGSDASFRDPYADVPVVLKRQDGVWRIPLEDQVTDAGKAEAMYRRLTRVVAETIPSVKQGATLVGIKSELGKRFQKEMSGGN